MTDGGGDTAAGLADDRVRVDVRTVRIVRDWLMRSGWSPGAAVLARIACSAVVLLVAAAAVDRAGLRDSPPHWRTIGGYGLTAIVGAQLAFFMAIQHLSVGVALMIQFLAPVVVIAWDWLVRHRRVGR